MADAPPTPQAMETYRNLMQEIKYREEAIRSVIEGKLAPVRTKIAEEFCFLQLRMICEVIAIACLVIHGNLKPKADLFKTYKADWIMSELAKLHPKFYPAPLEPQDKVTPGAPPEWISKTSGFLTREELQSLWQQSGRILHRGSAKILMQKERPLEYSKVSGWLSKIIRLLERHAITTPDGRWAFYVVMKEVKTGNVASNLFQKRSG